MRFSTFLFAASVVFISTFCCCPSFAQPSTFLRMYSNGNSGYTVREISGNSYVVAGGTDFYYNFHWQMMSSISTTNIHLLKTGSSGNLIWEKIFSNLSYRTTASWFEQTPDGGFIVCGSQNKDYIWPPDSNDVVLLKTNSSGALLWAKVYDTDRDELGNCVRPTFEGGVYSRHFMIPYR